MLPMRGVLLFCKVIRQIWRSHGLKKSSILTQMGVSGLYTNGYEIMHKAWSSIEEVHYCFLRSSVKFQGHKGPKNHKFWPELRVSGL